MSPSSSSGPCRGIRTASNLLIKMEVSEVSQPRSIFVGLTARRNGLLWPDKFGAGESVILVTGWPEGIIGVHLKPTKKNISATYSIDYMNPKNGFVLIWNEALNKRRFFMKTHKKTPTFNNINWVFLGETLFFYTPKIDKNLKFSWFWLYDILYYLQKSI